MNSVKLPCTVVPLDVIRPVPLCSFSKSASSITADAVSEDFGVEVSRFRLTALSLLNKVITINIKINKE